MDKKIPSTLCLTKKFKAFPIDGVSCIKKEKRILNETLCGVVLCCVGFRSLKGRRKRNEARREISRLVHLTSVL